MSLEHKRSHKQHRYIYSNSQQYIVWVKIIHFYFMTKIIRILRSCSMKIFSTFHTINLFLIINMHLSLLSTCSWCVVSALAPLSCGSRRVIQVDAAHWWWLRRDPPHDCKALWVYNNAQKALYKCIIHSFIAKNEFERL